MDQLRLRNYRCFDDTGDINLKPITLLLGANSSGKSSFIKFFPLMQQSLETRVNGLFLWDGQYVDFKNFKNTVRNGEGDITIDYTIGELDVNNIYGRNSQRLKEVKVSMVLCEKEEYYDYLKELTISFDKVIVNYIFSKDGKECVIEANGIKSQVYSSEKIILEFDNSLLPTMHFEWNGGDFRIGSSISQGALLELNETIGKENISGLDLLLNNKNAEFFSFNFQKNKEWLKKNNPKIKDGDLEHLSNVQIYLLSGLLVRGVNDYFTKMSRKFSYVLPLRSIMNRYYRFQNRNVDTIDPDGDNLAMFLNSLSDKEFDDFNKWLNEIFHFKLSIKKSEGHVEMNIEEEEKPQRNLVDVGFGFTQILPILTIIWKSVYGIGEVMSVKSRIVPITIAIEQPELHLHPRFQSCFAVMLAKVMEYCKSSRKQIRIIIETHSEVIVNKLGRLINDNNFGIEKNDINVVLFGANKEGLGKYVHTTSFSDDGGLNNWPFGFFSEDVY